jgi:hypothetical protein
MACSTHKYEYISKDLAEDALLDQHIYKGFEVHQGPQNVYECDICGAWHMTSKSDLRNERLQGEMDSGELKRKQRASNWERNF